MHTKLLILLMSLLLYNYGLAQHDIKYTVLKSTLTHVGSASNQIKSLNSSYYIQQSIGQSGNIGLAKRSALEVQQGFLNNLINIIIKNTESTFDEQIKIKVYPNPVVDQINLIFSLMPKDQVHIRLFNINNQLIFSRIYSAGLKITVPISHLTLNEGTYILEIKSAATLERKKIVNKNQ